MKKLYLFRHGQTDWNKEHRVQGSTDVPLNNTGLAQAEKLAHKLKQYDLDIILCSDLDRAMKTAEIANRFVKAPIQYTDALREIDSGDAEGLLIKEATQYDAINRKMHDLSIVKENHNFIPNGESPAQLMNRVNNYLEDKLNNDDYQNIGISTHGGVLKFLIMDHFAEIQRFDNCELIELNYCKKEKKLFRTAN